MRSLKMKKILIIDDEEDLAFFVKANLELAGDYKVLTATSGKDGIKLASRWQPDIILLDIMMPGMDGYETLNKLKSGGKTLKIPVIMLTAKADEDSKLKAASLYNEEYLIKPVQIDILNAKIKEVFARRNS